MLSSPEQMKLRFQALAASRSVQTDRLVACMLAFYASENGLKSLYMYRNRLAHSDANFSGIKTARNFSHRLDDLLAALKVPAGEIKALPRPILDVSGAAINIAAVHLAWRYGYPLHTISDKAVEDWIHSVIDYLGRQRELT